MNTSECYTSGADACDMLESYEKVADSGMPESPGIGTQVCATTMYVRGLGKLAYFAQPMDMLH